MIWGWEEERASCHAGLKVGGQSKLLYWTWVSRPHASSVYKPRSTGLPMPDPWGSWRGVWLSILDRLTGSLAAVNPASLPSVWKASPPPQSLLFGTARRPSSPLLTAARRRRLLPSLLHLSKLDHYSKMATAYLKRRPVSIHSKGNYSLDFVI